MKLPGLGQRHQSLEKAPDWDPAPDSGASGKCSRDSLTGALLEAAAQREWEGMSP